MKRTNTADVHFVLILHSKNKGLLPEMANSIKIRKGSDIRLKGAAELTLETPQRSDVFAIKPPNFHGLTPKLVAREGDTVKAGDCLFFDKYNDTIKFNSPVSGTVEEIVRGAKRRILEIRVKADAQNDYRDLGAKKASSMDAMELRKHLLEAGAWPFIVQRPFSIIARPDSTPKAIFISGFDSAPLAPDADFVMQGLEEDFQEGLNAMKVLANGKPVHIGVRPDSSFYQKMDGATLHTVSGPHPAGNVGVQIHHIDPINKGEVVWTINPQDVANIGRILRTGKYDVQRVVAVAGSKVNQPKYYRVTIGSKLDALTANIDKEGARIISGNPLNGEKVEADGFLGFFDHQVSALPEGDEAKFLLTDGWLSPGLNKFSLSHAFPTWLMPKSKRFDLDTNTNGEERAFVVTGQYEKVFPFDIYPVQLIKSIIVNDIDAMEKLGIYEVAPEDFALCEYACTSKIDVQEIVREGLDTIMKEFS